MNTIVEPKDHIIKLWGKQQTGEDNAFRMMKYVLQADYEKQLLLLNVVTGQLVVLNPIEVEVLHSLPCKYCKAMDQLIDGHFLVPEKYNEHQQVVKMREILMKLEEVQRKPGISHYTILPTTACNARCYYCFEQGSKTVTMTEDTAKAVVEFIINHCNEDKDVSLSWFGGEPTVAASRIDQICKGLLQKGIHYRSEITTNGYLFDPEMIKRAKELWKLERVKIAVDGTEKTYNATKAYVGVTDNPYKRVLENVGRFLEHGIKVTMRMNFDLGNYLEFPSLVNELKTLYHDCSLLRLNVHPVVGEYPNKQGEVLHGNDAWFEGKIVELNEVARKAGLIKSKHGLPCLKFHGCQAINDSAVVITPEGNLVRCPEQFGNDQVTGNIWQGVTNKDLVSSWKEIGDYSMCHNCALFPDCLRISHCSANTRCCFSKEKYKQYLESMKHNMCSYKKIKEERKNDV